jgi:hypothetical protein
VGAEKSHALLKNSQKFIKLRDTKCPAAGKNIEIKPFVAIFILLKT